MTRIFRNNSLMSPSPRTSDNVIGADLTDLMIDSTFACGRRTKGFKLLPQAYLQHIDTGRSNVRIEA